MKLYRFSLALLLSLAIPLFGVAFNWKRDKFDESIPSTVLSTGNLFPLVGFGVGNLQHELIMDRIEGCMTNGTKIILFDTAHASRNEDLVRTGIENGLKASKQKGPIHVVTKVWYTHLGYERTKLSVKASLESLKHKNVRVHILLHWPRCDDSIPWMNCEADEEQLPEETKQAGPPPHRNKDTAFLESWKALEDIYTGALKLGKKLPKVESIGVSNFYMNDLTALEEKSRITPHILQGNVFTYVFDNNLVEYCKQHNIHFQAFNVMNGILYHSKRDEIPTAMETLKYIAGQVSTRANSGEASYSFPQIVLKWLVQNNVSVIPRTTSLEHLKENSAAVIAAMPPLKPDEAEAVRAAVAAVLTQQDMTQTIAWFINKQVEGVLNLFWVNEGTGEEVPVKKGLAPGESFNSFTFRGHKFAIYNQHTDTRSEVEISAYHGQTEHFEL